MTDPSQPSMDTTDPRIIFATQIARIATMVTVAMRNGSEEQRARLEAELAALQARADRIEGAPPGLPVFLTAVRALLREEDPTPHAEGLPQPYRALFDEIMRSLDPTAMTVGEASAEIVRHTTSVLRRGTLEQRQRLGDLITEMREQSAAREDLKPFTDFLSAVRALVLGEGGTELGDDLEEPFRTYWATLMEGLQGSKDDG